MEIVNNVKNFLIEKKMLGAANDINNDDSLLEQGIIDSLGIQELVCFIEKKYGIKVDEDDLMPENFDSLSAISDFINGKIE